MILIAESKTMADGLREVSREEYLSNRPIYADTADRIMESLRQRSQEQLAEEGGLTPGLARSLQKMIYEFPEKALGMRAINAFTGVVFKQLHPVSYNEAQKKFLREKLRIISSLYGWLRPDDIIKQYRLDFKSRFAPEGETMMKFWKKDVTIALVNELREGCDYEIIDLLPADASKCIDWKLVKRFAKVYRADFKTVVEADILKTPNAGRLKELRGRLLDMVIRERLSSAKEIGALESADFMPAPETGYPENLNYITA